MANIIDLLYLSLGGLGRQVCYFVAFAHIASNIEASEFGFFSYWYALAMIFAGLSDWGMRLWGWREVARHPGDWSTINNIIVAKSFSTVGAAVLYLALAKVLAHGTYDGILPVSFLGMLVFNQLTIDWALRGLNKNLVVGLIGAISGATFLCQVYILGSVESLAVYGFLICFANFLGNIPGFVALLREGWRMDHIQFRQVFQALHKGAGYVAVSVMNRLYLNYPIVLLGLVGSRYETGVFRVGHMMYSLLVSSSYYVVGVTYTRLSKRSARRESVLPVLLPTCICTGVLLAILLAFLTPLIPFLIGSVFGPKYLDQMDVFTRLMLIAPVGFAHMMLRESLPAFSQKARTNYIIFLATATGVSICLALYSKQGLMGIIYGVGSGEAMGLICYATAVIREGAGEIARFRVER